MPRINCLLICLLMTTLLAGTAIAADETVLGARTPAISPDGKTLVFEYWGDLWSAPVDGSKTASRLTDHLAFDFAPQFSPDGKEVAFDSARAGGGDVWVIPATGGAARRVTGFSGNDSLLGWSQDGKRIMFASKRELWATGLYHIDARGQEPPVQVTHLDHYNVNDAVMLPDGGFVVSRGSGSWWTKNYRGSSQQDLWRIHPDGTHEQLTDHPGYDRWPMLGADGETIYYVTDVSGIANIWSLSPADGKRRQVTHHSTDGVQFPTISAGGDWITYEFDGGIYVLKVAGGSPQEVKLRISAETKLDAVSRRTFNNDAWEYATSPHGKYVVVVVEGDLWAVRDPKAWKEDEQPDQDIAQALRLTSSDDARERNPVFASDNRRIAYASDADGDYDIYIMDLNDLSVTRVTDDEVDNLEPCFDPSDDNILFYYTGSRKLVRQNLETGETSIVHEASFRGGFGYRNYAISPDGHWIAMELELQDWSSDLFIIDVTGEREPVNISRHPEWEGDAQWSADGKRLCFAARRHEDSGVYVIDLIPEGETYNTTFLFDDDLPEEPEEPEDATGDDDTVGDDDAGDDDGDAVADEESEDDNGDADKENGDEDQQDDDKDKDKDKDKQDKDKVTVEIDFTDIHLRARRVNSQDNAGSPLLSADGKWVIYATDPDRGGVETWVVKAEGGSARKLKDGRLGDAQWAEQGKRIYFRDGGTVRYLKFSDGNAKGTETVEARGEFWLDQRLRWRQMYREGWRTLRERFYDEDMHGVDWEAMYAKYAPFIDHIGTPEEFSLVFCELMGELNGSHLGITMHDHSYSGDAPRTGHLGVEFDPAYPGPGLLVSHITYQGPADQPGIELEPGDIVTEIEGTAVDNTMRWLDLLNDRSGDPVSLTVLDTADTADTRVVVIKATSFDRYLGLLYREWEIANENLVDELSGGRIGYIHISGMNHGELYKFEQEFFSEMLDKDALIVDVRFNPGGFIHEQLFDLLDRNVFGWVHDQGGDMVQQPGRVFNKPKALLINARSGSDAEIFPAGWRTLGLGPVIGTETAGAVIGTTGFTLIDGTYVRLPVNGWYELNGRNLELAGTPPDIAVEVHPDELKVGKDVQLERAVEVLMLELD